MSNSRAIILTIWIAAVIILLLPAYFLVFSHDISLWQLSRSLAAVKHLPNTKRLATVKDFGLLAGNGDHCDYFVGELHSYGDNVSPGQLKAFYKDVKIWNPINRRNENVSLGIVENGTIKTDEDWTEAGNFLKEDFQPFLPRKITNQKFYFVFLFDIGNPMGCDFRCS